MSSKASPWQPITDPMQLKILGKLLEESGELVSAAARCLIQGLDESAPVTGKANREWLEDEAADVLSKIYCMIRYLNLNEERITDRAKRKTEFHEPWFKGRV